ncbi:RHS repeat-associated core domain-containing protein [Rossellomorea sp. RS05]|uniref:RHS repeat-associated core domain-containing protein n=1 Tax=Rossellomorea sp. RS05 TaxID=3149166 RepID=UPI003221933F
MIVTSYVYDAWGNVLYQEGSYAAKNPHRYAGYQFDVETNNYYLMARFYNPKAGVFTSMDLEPGDDDDILTQDVYTYANNNPVMLVDPDGHYV